MEFLFPFLLIYGALIFSELLRPKPYKVPAEIEEHISEKVFRSGGIINHINKHD